MKYLLVVVCIFSSGMVIGQANTTQALQKEFDGSLSLYFYKNTLRMLNQKDNKEFDELIQNIEKMKFLMVDKTTRNFGMAEYQKLKADYQKEYYESILTSRYQGKNMDIYLKDKKGQTPGTLVLVNDSTSLYVLDIVGTFDVSKAGALFSVIDDSSDIGQQIKNFTNHKKKKGKDKDEDNDEDKSDH